MLEHGMQPMLTHMYQLLICADCCCVRCVPQPGVRTTSSTIRPTRGRAAPPWCADEQPDLLPPVVVLYCLHPLGPQL